MAIAPITSVKVSNNNSVNFSGKKKEKDDNLMQYSDAPKKVGKAVTIPVALLMAMSPGMVNGQNYEATNSQATEQVAQTKQKEGKFLLNAFKPLALKKKFKDTRDTKTEDYYHWINVWKKDGQTLYSCETAGIDERLKVNRKYTAIFVDPVMISEKHRNSDERYISTIFLIPHNMNAHKGIYEGVKDEDIYCVKGMVFHHDLGDKSNYYGLIVDGMDLVAGKMVQYEIRIPNAFAFRLRAFMRNGYMMVDGLKCKNTSYDMVRDCSSFRECYNTTEPDLIGPEDAGSVLDVIAMKTRRNGKDTSKKRY